MQTMVKIKECSTGAENQTATTVVKKNPYSPASSCTVTEKQFTDSSTLPGTQTRLLAAMPFWSSSWLDWSDVGGEGLWVDGACYVVVTLQDGTGFNSIAVTVVWEEL